MNQDIISYEVEHANEGKQNYIPPMQSADTLFHFVDKLDYLLPIIEKLAIIPRYCTEDIDYLDIGMKKIAYPMLCFCDINLHKMQKHIENYGGYGIAFSKEWGIANEIQPIQYVNVNAPLRKDFTQAFRESISAEEESSSQDFLLTQMYYFKAINGSMERNEETVYRNFTDECEWRYIPNVSIAGLPQAITEKDLFSKNLWNKALEVSNGCWLRFNVDDVKYIIIKDRTDFDAVASIINHKKNMESGSVDRLMSKILIWSDIRGDL